jgi:hypothetical protein
MDQERFDQLARGLASGTTRRGMVRQFTGAALGGILVAVGISEAGAKKQKHGHGKGKASSAGKDKVAVCHYDADAQTYVLINVSQSGWDNGHSKHKKDFQQADKNGCCLDSDCAKLTDECSKGTCVVNEQRVGACKAAPTPGAVCGTSNLCVSRRTCQADGTCGGGVVKPCANRECNTVQCNPNTGDCDYTPTPGAACRSDDLCLRHATCQADGTCGGGLVRPCQARQCNTVQCNPTNGDCDYTPTPGAVCDGGTCDDEGTCVECATCGPNCPGAAENNPTISVTFAPTGDPKFCSPTVHLTGFAGCTTYTYEYLGSFNSDGSSPESFGANHPLTTTDLSGSSQTTVGSFNNGSTDGFPRYVDFKLDNGRESGWQRVSC